NFSGIDEIDCAAELTHRLDFDARRCGRHDDGAGLAQELAGASEGLAEVAARSSDDVALRHGRREMAGGAKFEAACVLECLAGNGERHAKSARQTRRFNNGGGPDGRTDVWRHKSEI